MRVLSPVLIGEDRMRAKETKLQSDRQASETGVIRKSWRRRISVALTYPNTYHVGMSSLGFQTVYRLLNDIEDVVCERVFLPDRLESKPEGRSGSRMGSSQTKIRSEESGRPLQDFDVVAFSISFENDYVNLLTIFAQAGLPFRSGDRTADHPLIVAGGVAAFLNPEPIAPFVDCFLIGEAESSISEFADALRRYSDRSRLLEALPWEVPGCYVPAFYEVSYDSEGLIANFRPIGDFPAKIRRAVVADLSKWDTCSVILTPNTTFEDTFLIEGARGCPYGCRFCAAGFVYRPPRFRNEKQLEPSLEEAGRRAQRVGLVATAIPDIPHLDAICRKALSEGLQLSFSSLRADQLSSEFFNAVKNAGIKTATIAPDGGSDRMRRIINKSITEEDLLAAAEKLAQSGIHNLKLYFMVGLPGETIEDIDAIVALCKKIKQCVLSVGRARGRLGNLIVSVGSFVPKPFTPFQWAPLDLVANLKAKISRVKEGLRSVPNVKVSADVPKWAYMQALFSRGDRRVADILVSGCNNGWNWAKVLRPSSMNSDFFVYRERGPEEVLPWDFIDHGLDKAFLLREYHKALEGELSPPCRPASRCTICGVCRPSST